MAPYKEAVSGWNAYEFLVSALSWIIMIVTYNKAWLLVTHYEGKPELRRELDEDCFIARNGTTTCYNWGTGIRGRLDQPLGAVSEPSFWMYLSLYCARVLLFLIPVYFILPAYTKTRHQARLGPWVSGILTIIIAACLLIINLCLIFTRFIPGSVVDTIPTDYRLVFGWSYFVFNICALIPLTIGIFQFHKEDYIDLLLCINQHETLPSAPPAY